MFTPPAPTSTCINFFATLPASPNMASSTLSPTRPWSVKPMLLAAAFALLAGGTTTAQDAPPFDLFGQGSGISGLDSPAQQKRIKITSSLTAEKLQEGETAVLAITAQLPPGFYIYSTDKSFGGRTILEAIATAGLEPLDAGFMADRAPKSVDDPDLGQRVEKFYGDVTWFQRYRIAAKSDFDALQVSGTVNGQYCSSAETGGLCIQIRPAHEFTVKLEESAPPEQIAHLLAAAEPQPFEQTVRPTVRSGTPAPVELTWRLTPEDAAAGDEVVFEITAVLDEGWHLYAQTHLEENIGLPTVITTDPINLKAVDEGMTPSKPPELKFVEDLDVTQELHHGTVTWSQRFQVTDNAAAGHYGMRGTFRYQTCDEHGCQNPKTVEFELGQLVASSGFQPSRSGSAAGAAADTAESGEDSASGDEEAADVQGATSTANGLMPFILSAIAAGFLALLTPCVFPMVPITVSVFLKQSEKDHHRPFLTALVYCGGIMLTFTLFGIIISRIYGATALTGFANNSILNLVIAGVLVFFGMNLLGLFEIRVPSSLLNWTSRNQATGGYVGILFMSFTFTLVTFTCTFAFVGGLLVWAANGDYYWPIIGMLAFSAAFALPFFFLALFPSMMQRLPKSGGWMNAVKVTMGMVEIGAALKFLSVADLAANPNPWLFDYSFTMSAWMIISFCLGLYLLGLFRLSHDVADENISVIRFSIAMLFLTFGAYLGVGLLGKEEPKGLVWENIRAFAPGDFDSGSDAGLGPYVEHEGLKFGLDFDIVAEYANTKNQPLFIDFTGVNCVNCRIMEKRMTKPANAVLLEKFVKAQLYTDNVPSITDEQESQRLLSRNQHLQEDWFKDVTLPAYAIVAPDGKTILATMIGLEEREGQFAEFLEVGLKRWQQGSQAAAGTSVAADQPGAGDSARSPVQMAIQTAVAQ